LIAAMSLLILFVYLYRARKPLWAIAVPMVFLIGMTLIAMGMNLVGWFTRYGTEQATAGILTMTLGTLIFLCELWMVVEALILMRRLRQERVPA
jgi:carbon starvation protein